MTLYCCCDSPPLLWLLCTHKIELNNSTSWKNIRSVKKQELVSDGRWFLCRLFFNSSTLPLMLDSLPPLWFRCQNMETYPVVGPWDSTWENHMREPQRTKVFWSSPERSDWGAGFYFFTARNSVIHLFIFHCVILYRVELEPIPAVNQKKRWSSQPQGGLSVTSMLDTGENEELKSTKDLETLI